MVLIIALVIFGPKRLPELGKSMGKGIREFRSSVSGKDDDEDESKPAEIEGADPARRARRGRGRNRASPREPVARMRAAKHEERLTLVEHLDELRTRIIVSVAVLVVACGLCFWQNHLLLDIANKPLPGDQVPITFGSPSRSSRP